jgi:multidrug transporter EmrE-like cation transporter
VSDREDLEGQPGRKRPPHRHTSPLDLDYEPPVPAGERRRTGMVIALILASVVLAAVAQLTLKYGVERTAELNPGAVRGPVDTVMGALRHPAVLGGFVLFGVSALFWILVLSRASLSFAYPFASLTYVLILVFDRIALDEPVSLLRWAGVALIIGGLVLVSRTHP